MHRSISCFFTRLPSLTHLMSVSATLPSILLKINNSRRRNATNKTRKKSPPSDEFVIDPGINNALKSEENFRYKWECVIDGEIYSNGINGINGMRGIGKRRSPFNHR